MVTAPSLAWPGLACMLQLLSPQPSSLQNIFFITELGLPWPALIVTKYYSDLPQGAVK